MSQLIDSFVVLYIAFVLGPQHWQMSLFLAVGTLNYIYKMLAAIALIPLLYLARAGIHRYVGSARAAELQARAEAQPCGLGPGRGSGYRGIAPTFWPR